MKKIKEFTYVAALGYAGGGVYEEFFGKLKYDQVTTDPDVASVGIVGFWTEGSDEWQEKINDVLVNEELKYLKLKLRICMILWKNVQLMMARKSKNLFTFGMTKKQIQNMRHLF